MTNTIVTQVSPTNPHDLRIAYLQDLHDSLTRSVRAAERVLWPEAYAAMDEAKAAAVRAGDMHSLPELLGSLELQMYDSCLGAPHSDGEAGCVLLELEERGIYVEPVLCSWCGRTHLVKAGR